MAVPLRYVLHQGPVLKGMGEAALSAVKQRLGLAESRAVETPGPEHTITVPPRPDDLVNAYVRHVGGDPSSYRGRVPPHLFPQWTFPLSGRLLEGLKYPMMAVMNAGCRMTVNAPIRAGQPLTVTGRLESVDDDGRRAILDQRFVTGTPDHPEALVTHMFVFVPLGGGKGGKKEKKEGVRVPQDARELAFWKLRSDAGLDFAKLTGDFNPVHWVPAWARMLGFRNTILHGFGTFSRAVEGLHRGLFAGDVNALREVEVRFTRPLVLPAKVGLYVKDQQFWVGTAAGGPAYLEGRFEPRGRQG